MNTSELLDGKALRGGAAAADLEFGLARRRWPRALTARPSWAPGLTGGGVVTLGLTGAGVVAPGLAGAAPRAVLRASPVARARRRDQPHDTDIAAGAAFEAELV